MKCTDACSLYNCSNFEDDVADVYSEESEYESDIDDDDDNDDDDIDSGDNAT